MNLKPWILVSALSLIYFLEGMFPHMHGRKQRLRHALPHLVTALINSILTGVFLGWLTWYTVRWSEEHSFGLARWIKSSLPVTGFISFLIFDAYMYFWHRANHSYDFLWRFHRAHHSDTMMDSTTALRFHPGELVLSSIFRVPVIALTGIGLTELYIFELTLNTMTLFHHSNLGLGQRTDRAVRLFITSPDMHRIHHSLVLSEMSSNFTSILSLWDRLFGTFREKDDTSGTVFGLTGFRKERWQGFTGFMLSPFINEKQAK